MEHPKAVLEALVGRLRQRRVDSGWTQAHLAKRAGIPVRAVQQFEQSASINLVRFYKIVQALGLESELRTLFKEQVEGGSLFDSPSRKKRPVKSPRARV